MTLRLADALRRELVRRAYAEIAAALLAEEAVRHSYWTLTDALWPEEELFARRCALYNQMARARKFPVLAWYEGASAYPDD